MHALRVRGRVLLGTLALAAGACTPPTQAGPDGEPQRESSGLKAALEQLDSSTEEGRRAAYERLKRECEDLRARLEGAAQDAKLKALEQRDKGLTELVALCDGLERRLDQLEDSGGEQWTKLRTDALEQAERLRLECQRLLDEKR